MHILNTITNILIVYNMLKLNHIYGILRKTFISIYITILMHRFNINKSNLSKTLF